MLDKNGREINYMRVSITPRCNLRCAYCLPSGQGVSTNNRDLLSDKNLIRLITIFATMGIKKVRLTGGEPLVRKGLAELVRDIKRINGMEEVALSTNGVLLLDAIDGLLASGLDKINISLDSLKRERIKEISGFDVLPKIEGAIRKIISDGLWRLKLNAVIIKGFNDDEINDFAELAAIYPLEVRFIEMMPTAKNRLWDGKKPLTGAEIMSKVETKYRLMPIFNREKTGGPARVYAIASGKGRVGFISPMSEQFCDSCNRLRLTAEGTIRHCLFSDMEVDLRPGLAANAPDEWFRDKFLNALIHKPAAHNLTMQSPPPCSRAMVSIGG
jgi:cyclic pyranopterin phosphate synthase